MIKRYSKKGLEKRKEERECLPEFFKKHINIAKGMYCEECGERLKGNVSEIAHILPKNYFKSIMCSDLNVLYLCGLYSNNNCHYNFDNFAQEEIRTMNIFPKTQLAFEQLKNNITEKITYKHYEKFE